jgi:hypothetical protein
MNEAPWEEVNRMTDEEIQDFIHNSSWKFAKTMAKTPHWYTLRKYARDEAMFERFVLHIRGHGYKQKFGKTWYTYFNVGNWQYWTLGCPLEQTILINRAQIVPDPTLAR